MIQNFIKIKKKFKETILLTKIKKKILKNIFKISLIFFIAHLAKVIKLMKDWICKYTADYAAIKLIKLFQLIMLKIENLLLLNLLDVLISCKKFKNQSIKSWIVTQAT